MIRFTGRITAALCILAALLPTAGVSAASSPTQNGSPIQRPPSRQSAAGVIVYNSNLDGDQELYVMNADGSGSRQLTFNSSNDTNADWSSDGSRLVYMDGSQSTFKLAVMNSDGSGMRLITSGSQRDENPHWQGTVNPTNQDTEIVFESDRDGDMDLYVVDYLTGSVRQQTNTPGLDSFATWEWTNRCSEIVFQSNRGGSSDLYATCAYDTFLETRQLTFGANAQAPDLSNDGTKVVYQADQNGAWDIYTLDLVTNTTRRLTNGEGGNWVPQWSADGTQVVFVSNRDGDNEIFVINADGTNLRQLTFNSVSDEFPSWSPVGGSASGGAPVAAQPAQPAAASSTASVMYSDDFSNPATNWPVFDDTRPAEDYYNRGRYQNGVYHVEQRAKDMNMWLFNNGGALADVGDFTLTVDVTVLTSVGMPGIVFRGGPERFYWFRIDPSRQQYILMIDYRNGQFTALVSDTYSAAINPGTQTNRLGITQTGSSIALMVNGQLLTQVSDGQYTRGSIGFWITSPGSPDGRNQDIVIEYDNLTVTAPQPLPAQVSQPAQPAQPAQSNPSQCMAVSADGDGLNVRSGPGTNYNALGTLGGTQQIQVLGYRGDWYVVNYNGRQGWLANWIVRLSGSCSNLALFDASGAPAAQPAAKCTLQADQDTTVRIGPGEDYEALGMLIAGQSVEAAALYGTDWYAVTFNGQQGWVLTWVTTPSGNCDNLTIIEEPPPQQQPPAGAAFQVQMWANSVPVDQVTHMGNQCGNTQVKIEWQVTGATSVTYTVLVEDTVLMEVQVPAVGSAIETRPFMDGASATIYYSISATDGTQAQGQNAIFEWYKDCQ